MLRTVQIDYGFIFVTIEVHYVIAYNLLAINGNGQLFLKNHTTVCFLLWLNFF